MPVTTRAMAKRCCRRPSPSMSVEATDKFSNRGRGVEEGENQWIGRIDHPLLNDVVLTTLFAYVGGNDLKECRLVSKKWHLRTLPFAGPRLQVTISGKTKEVKEFVELFGSNRLGFPKFEKFILGPFDTRKGFGQKLLKLFGQTVKEFILVSEDVTNYHDKIEDITELVRSAPNLESFKTTRTLVPKRRGVVVKLFSDSEVTRKPKLPFLTTLYFRHDWARYIMEICPTFYEELFQAAENLSTLTVMGFCDDSNCEILNAIEKFGRETTIENLKLGDVTSDHFDSLHRMALKPNGLKLKQLDFTSWFSDADWFELITFFSDTLVALRKDFYSGDQILNTFPHMPNLKFLYLHMTEIARLRFDNFHNTFPVLENVELSICTLEQFNDLMTGDERNYVLKASIFCVFPMTLEIFNRIVRLFPNLRKFECQVTPEDGVQVIKNIWTHMTQLEHLQVDGTLPASTNLDSLVTGIPIRQIRKMLGRKELFVSLENQNIEDRRETIFREINKHDECVSVRNLTNLNFLNIKLTVEVSGNKSQQLNYLTDFTGYFGFYTFKSLLLLGVTDCEFSKSCAEILVKDLGLEYWGFHHAKTHNQIIPWKPIDESHEHTFPLQV